MPPVRASRDVFGQALVDWARGGTDAEIIERDDGMIDLSAGHELYVAGFEDWPLSERKAIRYVRGRVIDVGCGAGRVSLYLQERGFDVVGLDGSPLALKAARFRGVQQTWHLSVEDLSGSLASFETIVLFGNNFGVFGTPERARRVLASWAKATPSATRILAESTNPYAGGAPVIDRKYYWSNKSAGRSPGQLRIRSRYRGLVGEWSDWLFVSREEMRAVLRGTGWHVGEIVGGRPTESYVAILEKR